MAEAPRSNEIRDVSVYRPDRYRIAPLWRPEIVESCIGRFKMKIDPLSHDAVEFG